MGVFIFSNKEASLKNIFPKNSQFLPLPLSSHTPGKGDITYIDISGFASDAEIKKALAQLKKCCDDTPWGIIDPKGAVKDIAPLFIDGASDYLGSGFLKEAKAVDSKRLKDALSWRKDFLEASAAVKEDAKSSAGRGVVSIPKTGIKLPAASSFPGWNKMPTGRNTSFYLLYCSLQGKFPLDTKLDDKSLIQVNKRFVSYIDNELQKSNALFWVNSGRDYLFLIPPIAKCADAAIRSCIGMLISAPLIVMESLNIKFPANFIFAFHYGSLSYRPPGHTGTVVSDAVNYIFHLGTKSAEPGRLTISGELPDGTIPKALEDCFVSAGEFEDRKIWHTKKFIYAKPWM